MYDQIFNFKFQGKQMEREAAKAKKQQDAYTNKLKQAIASNNMAMAKQYGEQALRAKKDVTRYQNLSSKVNTIASKLSAAYKNQQLTGQMASMVRKLGQMNFNMVGTMETLENFEQMFDNIDVKTKMMDDVLDNIGVGTVNDQEVNELLQQCAEGQANKIDEMMLGPNREALNNQGIRNQNYANPLDVNFFP